jgi:hypothetical protein
MVRPLPARSPLAFPALQLQFRHRTGHRLGHERLEPLHQTKRSADPQEARKSCRHLARFQPLEGALRAPCLLGQSRLRQVALQPRGAQARAQFPENAFIDVRDQ